MSAAYEGLAQRGDVLGWLVLDGESMKFTPLSPGRRHQVRASRFAALRACWREYVVVGYV